MRELYEKFLKGDLDVSTLTEKERKGLTVEHYNAYLATEHGNSSFVEFTKAMDTIGFLKG